MKLKVNVIYIRHGFSCANASQEIEPIYNQFQRVFNADAPLTDYAVKGIKDLRPESNFDFVLCSTLRRAEETALLLFPDKSEILVVPYIKEIGFVDENQNDTTPTKQMCKISQDIKADRLNYYYSADHPTSWKPETNQVDYNKFVNHILVDILKNIDIKSNRRTVNIAVVTHSVFMKKVFKTTNKPLNVGTGKIVYQFDTKSNKIVEISKTPKENSSFSSTNGMPFPKNINSKDINRCINYKYDNISDIEQQPTGRIVLDI